MNSVVVRACAVLLIAGLRVSALSQPPTGFLPKPVAILLPPGPTPLSVLIRRPFPLLPYGLDSLLPPSPFIPAQAFLTFPVALPVNHTFQFGSPSTAYTGPVIHCLPSCPPGGGGGGVLGQRSGFIRGCAALGSEPLPYFRESRTPKTYPILGKSHNPGHPKRSGLQNIPYIRENFAIPGSRSGPDSENIPYFREIW